MSRINILDNETVDRIAAGEVVERPANVVKELVENAIDAGADSITVEIKEGGISMIRVTDNGSGIEPCEITKAFMRHATSKIENAEDLGNVISLGFRGEALSSISAVCQVEMLTKTRDSLCGIRAVCNGGKLETPKEAGVPDGTTIIVRNIFYNTPVRRKFLKTAMTEGGYISDIMQHIALSKPQIAFQFINNGQTKFFTSGNGDLKEVIYRIYGKDTQRELAYLCKEENGIKLEGYIGKPVLNRSNRSFETFFVNGRYIKSQLVCKALEEGYKGYLMQHKYPFTVLHFTIEPELIDVNVHPTKMDIRILNQESFLRFVSGAVHDTLLHSELIPDIAEPEHKSKAQIRKEERALTKAIPASFETKRVMALKEEGTYQAANTFENFFQTEPETGKIQETRRAPEEENTQSQKPEGTDSAVMIVPKPDQLALFDDSIMNADIHDSYEILGQLFDTYWILAFHEKMYLVDQHAAHEKVKYERLVRHLKEKQIFSQNMNPPVVVTLDDKEKAVFVRYYDAFVQMGFEIEEFGGNDYALRAVPVDLYGCGERELFLSVLDELTEFPIIKDSELVLDKIASMSCKAAVKGNTKLSFAEAETLMRELLTCENPFQCPHGRPTIVSMTKYEIEKKFKRIL